MSSPLRYKVCKIESKGDMKSERKVEGRYYSNEAQELPTPGDQLDQLRGRYGESGWDWPQVAGSSSEGKLSGLRHELSAVQRAVRSRVGDLTRGLEDTADSEPVTYTYDELRAMASGGLYNVQCALKSSLMVRV